MSTFIADEPRATSIDFTVDALVVRLADGRKGSRARSGRWSGRSRQPRVGLITHR